MGWSRGQGPSRRESGCVCHRSGGSNRYRRRQSWRASGSRWNHLSWLGYALVDPIRCLVCILVNWAAFQRMPLYNHRCRRTKRPGRTAPGHCIYHFITASEQQHFISAVAQIYSPARPASILHQVGHTCITLHKFKIWQEAVDAEKYIRPISNHNHLTWDNHSTSWELVHAFAFSWRLFIS